MGKEAFEQILGWHGAPTFAGAKPATLLSFKKSRFEDFDALLASYAPCFRCKGISLCRLAEGAEYVLILFYRVRAVARLVKRPEVRSVLTACGYDEGARLGDLLAELRRRMALKKSFPHEVGLFLGYPPADVRGFMEHHGQQCALAGYWKVYGNAEQARGVFDAYAHCAEEFCEKLGAGAKFEDLVLAV